MQAWWFWKARLLKKKLITLLFNQTEIEIGYCILQLVVGYHPHTQPFPWPFVPDPISRISNLAQLVMPIPIPLLMHPYCCQGLAVYFPSIGFTKPSGSCNDIPLWIYSLFRHLDHRVCHWLEVLTVSNLSSLWKYGFHDQVWPLMLGGSLSSWSKTSCHFIVSLNS